jgi:hypothetical protein
MEEYKFSDDVFEQIKDFSYNDLSEEQSMFIDNLILNEELKERYKNYDLCKECKQPNTGYSWCKSCNSKRFQQNFENWTSGNNQVDKFIQNAQLKAKNHDEILEWIEYNRFENVEYLAKGGFGTIHKAIWKDGFIEQWDFINNKWKRIKRNPGVNLEIFPIVLKCLHNSQNITAEFLKEVCCFIFFQNI